MKLYIKYDINKVCRTILEEQLNKLGINYELKGLSEFEVNRDFSEKQKADMNTLLNKYGIEIVDDRISNIVQKTKDSILELVNRDEKLPDSKISFYLAKKLNYSYGYLAELFSEITHTSIENYYIIQKIERAKQLIADDELTFTEISYKLNYSSLSHLSSQFKKITGLTPSSFERIIKKRREVSL